MPVPPFPPPLPSPWQRGASRLLIGLLIAYFFVCYRFSLHGLGVADRPEAVSSFSHLFWLGRWRMFTDERPFHTAVQVSWWTGQGWVPGDPEALHPNRWPEGPGWIRDEFLNDPRKLTAWAQLLCPLGPEGTQGIRMLRRKWSKTLGQISQPEVDLREEVLWETACPLSASPGSP